MRKQNHEVFLSHAVFTFSNIHFQPCGFGGFVCACCSFVVLAGCFATERRLGMCQYKEEPSSLRFNPGRYFHRTFLPPPPPPVKTFISRPALSSTIATAWVHLHSCAAPFLPVALFFFFLPLSPLPAGPSPSEPPAGDRPPPAPSRAGAGAGRAVCAGQGGGFIAVCRRAGCPALYVCVCVCVCV